MWDQTSELLPIMCTAFVPTLPLPWQQHGDRIKNKGPCCTAGRPEGDYANQLRATLSAQTARIGLDAALAPLIDQLESRPESADCNTNASILGVWRNAHTGKSNTASSIQRTVVSSQTAAPAIHQVIVGSSGRLDELPPSNVVTRVDLRAALGAILNLRANITSVDGSKLNIRFVQAWFAFTQFPDWCGGAALPKRFNFPYPVPFRLLGKKACGWLDITYLQHDLRICRGNRGTVFVLTRVDEHDHLPGLDDIRAMCTSDFSEV